MSDTERVRAWRQRLKDEGRVAMSIWVKADTKARYEDFALTYHQSPSELAQQALDAWSPTQGTSAATVADTTQLRAMVQAELQAALPELVQAVQQAITATVAATVAETPDQAEVPAGQPSRVDAQIRASTQADAARRKAEGYKKRGAKGLSPVDSTEDTAGDKRDIAAASPPDATDTVTATVADTVAPAAPPDQAPTRRKAPAKARTAPAPTPQVWPTAHKLTPMQAAELRGKRTAGVPVKQLMQDYGISRASVFRYVQDASQQ